MESESSVVLGGDRWVENLRGGICNIVGRISLPHAKRAELLLHWVPYCLARYQLDVAFHRLGEPTPPLPVDLRFGANTVRGHAQTLVNRCPVVLGEALAATASDMASHEPDPTRRSELEVIAERGGGRGAALKDTRAFFTSTMYAVGALNAPAGLRHFTLKLPLVETLVSAGLRPGTEMSFDRFCQAVLFERFGLVVDGRSAATHLAETIDTAEFDENAEVFARQLDSLASSPNTQMTPASCGPRCVGESTRTHRRLRRRRTRASATRARERRKRAEGRGLEHGGRGGCRVGGSAAWPRRSRSRDPDRARGRNRRPD